MFTRWRYYIYVRSGPKHANAILELQERIRQMKEIVKAETYSHAAARESIKTLVVITSKVDIMDVLHMLKLEIAADELELFHAPTPIFA